MFLPLSSTILSAFYAVLLSRLDSLVNCVQCFRRQCLCCPGFFPLFSSLFLLFSNSMNDWKAEKQRQKNTFCLRYDVEIVRGIPNAECRWYWCIMRLIRLVVGWYGSQGYCFNSNWILTHVLHKFSFRIDLNSNLSSFLSAFGFKICID